VTRVEKLYTRRERAWFRWRLLRATLAASRAWAWLLAWDAAYHEELRTNPAALAAAKR
jgi:hypothetical protein